MSNTTDLSNLDNQTAQIYGTGSISLPAGTKAQRPKNPKAGMLRLNTTSGKIEYYDNTEWTNLVQTKDGDLRYVMQDTPKINADMDAQNHNVKNLPDTPVDLTSAINGNFLNTRLSSGVDINASSLDGHDSSYFATQTDVLIINSNLTALQGVVDTHVADHANPHQVTKAQVGLDRADNTNDIEKPISTATQAALDTKVNRAGDTMQGNLSMGGFNLTEVMNFVGSIWYFALPVSNIPTAPAGFLVANGSAVSRTTYARLYSKIGNMYGAGDGSTTFNLPDLRGVFARGLDAGRGIDMGREMGGFQQDSNQAHVHDFVVPAHTHTGTTNDAGAHNHKYYCGGLIGGSSQNGIMIRESNPSWGYANYMEVAGNHNHTFTTSASNATNGQTAMSGGSESRPKNVALLACIMI
jgi:microcystin-dependent protein